MGKIVKGKLILELLNEINSLAELLDFALIKGQCLRESPITAVHLFALETPWAIQGSFANCNISVDLDLFNEGITEYI